MILTNFISKTLTYAYCNSISHGQYVRNELSCMLTSIYYKILKLHSNFLWHHHVHQNKNNNFFLIFSHTFILNSSHSRTNVQSINQTDSKIRYVSVSKREINMHVEWMFSSVCVCLFVSIFSLFRANSNNFFMQKNFVSCLWVKKKLWKL